MRKITKIILVVYSIDILLGIFLCGFGFGIMLFGLSIAAYIQNMSFTWVSRSRQGGDVEYHRYAAWASNITWLVTQTFIAANVYTPITNMVKNGITFDSVLRIVLTFIIYSIATSEGSVVMMKINLGKYKLPKYLHFLIEDGKRKVGER